MTKFAAQLKHISMALVEHAERLLTGLVAWGLGGPKSYRPEAHYMRGPGPKWHEKHGHPETYLAKARLLGDKWDY